MARTWDVPGLLRAIPAPLFLAWKQYHDEEPWDVPQVLAAPGHRSDGVSGDDPDALGSLFHSFAGGA